MRREEGWPVFGPENPCGAFWNMPAFPFESREASPAWHSNLPRDSCQPLSGPQASCPLCEAFSILPCRECLLQASQALRKPWGRATESPSLVASARSEGMLGIGSPLSPLKCQCSGECPAASQSWLVGSGNKSGCLSDETHTRPPLSPVSLPPAVSNLSPNR